MVKLRAGQKNATMKVTHYAGHRVEIGQMTAYMIEVGLDDVIVYTKTAVYDGRLWPYMFIPNAKPVTWRDDKIGIEVAPNVWAPEEYKDQVKAHLEKVQTKRSEKFIEIDQNLNAVFYDSMGELIKAGSQVKMVTRWDENNPLSYITQFGIQANGMLNIYGFSFTHMLLTAKEVIPLNSRSITGLPYAISKEALPKEIRTRVSDFNWSPYKMESFYIVREICFI